MIGVYRNQMLYTDIRHPKCLSGFCLPRCKNFLNQYKQIPQIKRKIKCVCLINPTRDVFLFFLFAVSLHDVDNHGSPEHLYFEPLRRISHFHLPSRSYHWLTQAHYVSYSLLPSASCIQHAKLFKNSFLSMCPGNLNCRFSYSKDTVRQK